MDCERFDHVVIDALYGELDELTLAALRRHAESCTRCQAAWAGLRATRKIGVLPLAAAPSGLSARAVAYARDAQRNVSWTTQFGRVMSRAAGYAMRPQTAMAAIFMLAVGGAVLFLRPRPERSAAQSHVSVTEHGVPELTGGEQARPVPAAPLAAAPGPGAMRRDEAIGRNAPPSPAAEPPLADPRVASAAKSKVDDDLGEPTQRARGQVAAGAERKPSGAPPEVAALRASEAAMAAEVQGEPSGSGSLTSEYVRAKELYQAQRYGEAERAFLAVARQGGKDAAWSQFYAAKSAEAENGCRDAAAKYEAVDTKFPATGAGAEGLFGAANCYRALGDAVRARQIYGSLRSTPAYRDRADTEIAALAAGAAAAQPARAAKPSVAPARKPGN